MLLKCLNKYCPVCEEMIFAQRNTRVYCGEDCKATHHRNARNQIRDSVEFEIIKRLLAFKDNPAEFAKVEDNIKLFSRNLYLFESVMGPNYNSFSVDLQEFKCQKFQLTECSSKIDTGDKVVYTLGSYRYWLEGKILHVERVGAINRYRDAVVGRWLVCYPEFGDRAEFGVSELEELKNHILKVGLVWRE